MQKLIHPVTLLSCHFCKAKMDNLAHEESYFYPDDKTKVKMGLVEYRCFCGKAKAFVDLKNTNGDSTLKMLEVGEGV